MEISLKVSSLLSLEFAVNGLKKRVESVRREGAEIYFPDFFFLQFIFRVIKKTYKCKL